MEREQRFYKKTPTQKKLKLQGASLEKFVTLQGLKTIFVGNYYPGARLT